jgi:hypothetical protein
MKTVADRLPPLTASTFPTVLPAVIVLCLVPCDHDLQPLNYDPDYIDSSYPVKCIPLPLPNDSIMMVCDCAHCTLMKHSQHQNT